MREINCTIRDRRMIGDQTIIICGNSDYLVHFDFDDEWKEFETKTMRVKWKENYTDILFSGESCFLPAIESADEIQIGVYAGNLRTTTAVRFKCLLSITSMGGFPADPMSDVYEQIIEKLDSKVDKDSWKYVGKVSVASDDEASEMTIDKDTIGNTFMLRRFRIRGTIRANNYDNIDGVYLFVNYGEDDFWVSRGRIVTGTRSTAYGLSFDITAENICGRLSLQTILTSTGGTTEETGKILRNSTVGLVAVDDFSESLLTNIRTIRLSTEAGNKVICGGGSWMELYGVYT